MACTIKEESLQYFVQPDFFFVRLLKDHGLIAQAWNYMTQKIPAIPTKNLNAAIRGRPERSQILAVTPPFSESRHVYRFFSFPKLDIFSVLFLVPFSPKLLIVTRNKTDTVMPVGIKFPNISGKATATSLELEAGNGGNESTLI